MSDLTAPEGPGCMMSPRSHEVRLATETADAEVPQAGRWVTGKALEVRETDATLSGRFMEGRAVPYGVWQDVRFYMEMIRQGAFEKSIKEANYQLPLLLFHDYKSFPVGVSERWTESDAGLDCVWRLSSSEQAQEAARLAREGMLTGLSVGFQGIHAERSDDGEYLWVERTEARLLEVSLTPTPAYGGAKVSTVRTRERFVNGVLPRRQGNGSAPARRRSAEVDALKRYLESIKRG